MFDCVRQCFLDDLVGGVVDTVWDGLGVIFDAQVDCELGMVHVFDQYG